MLRNCKFERDEDRYGHFPLTNRFSMDQVPIEISRRNTTPEQQGRSTKGSNQTTWKKNQELDTVKKVQMHPTNFETHPLSPL